MAFLFLDERGQGHIVLENEAGPGLTLTPRRQGSVSRSSAAEEAGPFGSGRPASSTPRGTPRNDEGGPGGQAPVARGTPRGQTVVATSSSNGQTPTAVGTPGGQPPTATGTPRGQPSTDTSTTRVQQVTVEGASRGQQLTASGTPGGQPLTGSGTPRGQPQDDSGDLQQARFDAQQQTRLDATQQARPDAMQQARPDAMQQARLEAMRQARADVMQAQTRQLQAQTRQLQRLPPDEVPRPIATTNRAFMEGEVRHQDRYAMIVEGGEPLALCGAQVGNPCQQLLAMAGMQPAAQGSFIAFFRAWFEKEFFPALSLGLQQEMQRRTSRHGLFAALAHQVQGLVNANTRASLEDEVRTYENIRVGVQHWSMLKNMELSMEADVWCKHFLEKTPPQYGNYGVMRTASVNLGAAQQPCWATFYAWPGAEEQWSISPLGIEEPDCVALIDELDSRGGLPLIAKSPGAPEKFF